MANLMLFAQIISKLDKKSFTRMAQDKQTDKHQKGYDSWTHLVFYRIPPHRL